MEPISPAAKVYKVTLLKDYSDLRLEQFPVKFKYRDYTIFGILALFFGGSFVLIPIAFLIKTMFSGEPVAPALFLLIISALALPLLIKGLKWITRKKEIVIDRNYIAKTDSHLFKKNQWQEPIKSYSGVLFRTDVELTGDGHSDLGYILELKHNDPAKTLCIYRSLQHATAYANWQYYCQVFGLPPMERVGKGQYILREAKSLTRPLMELVRENPTLFYPTPPHRPVSVLKTVSPHVETIGLPDYTEIEFGEHSFTISQKSIYASKTTFNYSQIQAVLIDYSKVYLKWAWAVVILGPELSNRFVLAHDLPYELLQWLQYYLMEKILRKSV